MARVRIAEPVTRLQSWEEVDITLADIGERVREIEAIEARMQQGIDGLKLEADTKAAVHQKAIKELQLQIKTFVDENPELMGGKKTKVLTFGSVGYRKSTKIKLPKSKDKLRDIFAKLRSKGMTDCIVIPPEKIDKNVLAKYTPNEIIEVGANVDVVDTFWYELDRQRIEQK